METIRSSPWLDRLLFLFFPMPLMMALVTTAGESISGAIFILLYAASGYWRNWRIFFSRPWTIPLLLLISLNILGLLWTTDLHRGFIVVSKLNYFVFSFAGATLPWNARYFRWTVISFLTGVTTSFMIGLFQFLGLIPGMPMDPALGPKGIADYTVVSLALANALLWIIYDLKFQVVLPPAANTVLGIAFFVQLVLIAGRVGQVIFFLLFPIALFMILPERWKGFRLLGIIALCAIIFLSSPIVRKRFATGLDDLEAYRRGFATTSLGIRLVFWEGAVKMAMESPFFGVGTGDYGIELAELQKRHAVPQTPGADHFDNPHNSYLAYFSGLGIAGLASLLWFLFAAAREAWEKWRTPTGWFKLCYFGIFFLGSIMDTLMWGHDHAYALAIITAIPLAEKNI